MSNKMKKGLVPELRFPEFRDGGCWDDDKLSELIATVTPPKKLPTNLYQEVGQYPVIDQSQKTICAWTNDKEALIYDGFPLIVFGDHTCILKIALEPFAQGADGIKILKAKDGLETGFLYQALQVKPVVMQEYKRHFSILKEKIVAFPKKESGEQQKISDCLFSLDELIAAQAQKHQALQSYKKGLLQNLFPAEGETVPALRFPEFENSGEWRVSTINDIATISSGGTPSRSNHSYWGDQIPWVSTSLIDFNKVKRVNEYITKEGLKNSSAKMFPKGTILMAMYGQGKTRGKVAILGIEAAINQACAAISLKKGMNGEFVFQNLASRYDEIRNISNQGGQENLSGALIKTIPFSYPKIGSGEQERIADCLASVDDLISSQMLKIEELKAHKKGLMQQLFPAMDEAVK